MKLSWYTIALQFHCQYSKAQVNPSWKPAGTFASLFAGKAYGDSGSVCRGKKVVQGQRGYQEALLNQTADDFKNIPLTGTQDVDSSIHTPKNEQVI